MEEVAIKTSEALQATRSSLLGDASANLNAKALLSLVGRKSSIPSTQMEHKMADGSNNKETGERMSELMPTFSGKLL